MKTLRSTLPTPPPLLDHTLPPTQKREVSVVQQFRKQTSTITIIPSVEPKAFYICHATEMRPDVLKFDNRFKRKHLQYVFGGGENLIENINENNYNVLFSGFDTGILGTKKKWVLLSGLEPNTFWLLVRMLYYWATGDSWELRPFFNEVHVTNILHAGGRISMSIYGVSAQWNKSDGIF